MRVTRALSQFVLAIAVPAVFGVVERIVQDHSATGWYLANIAGVWLAVPFVFGAIAPRRARALMLGFVAEMSALGAFYGYMRFGEHHYEPLHLIAFWACCGVIAGPVFGLIGYTWRRRRSEIAGMALGATFVAEAALLAFARDRPRSVTELESVVGVLVAAMLVASVRWRNRQTQHGGWSLPRRAR